MSVQKDKSQTKKVAYLGMGIMGAAMAHNLLKPVMQLRSITAQRLVRH